MRGKYLLFIALFLLSTLSVLGVSQIDIEATDNQIEKGQLANYKATITNELDEAQTYSIYYLLGGLDWQVTTSPATDRVFTLGPGQTKTLTLTVRPIKDFDPGIYAISPVIVETDKGELYRRTLRLQLGRPGPQDYSPEVKVTTDLSANIDPRESQNIRVTVENFNPLEYDPLILRTKSEIDGFTTEQEFTLGALEKKTLELTVKPNAQQQPKEYLVLFILERNEEIIGISEKRVTVQPLDIDYAQGVTEQKSFLKSTKTLVVTNDGNTISTRQVALPVGVMASLFTISNPTGTFSKQNGKRSLVWDVKLGPGEEATLRVVTSYRVPISILFIILLLVIVYFVKRNEIVVTKSAGNVKVHEGGVSGLKITLLVHNISSQPVKDVRIVDYLPGIAHVEKELDMGTLRPSSVKPRKNKTEVTWKLTELEGHEERLISYKIKSKLNIVGTLTLPRSKVKYKTARGTKKQSFSNTFSIGRE